MSDITNKYSTPDGRPLGTPHENDMEENFSRLRYTFPQRDGINIYLNADVLDCGGGYGTGADEVVKLGANRVISVDVNPDAIELALRKFPNEKIVYKCSSWFDIAEKVNVVIAVELVEHLTTTELLSSLELWNNLLTTNGILYVTTPRRRAPKEDFPRGSHFTEYDFDELVSIISPFGFSLEWYADPENTDSISMAFLFRKVDNE